MRCGKVIRLRVLSVFLDVRRGPVMRLLEVGLITEIRQS